MRFVNALAVTALTVTALAAAPAFAAETVSLPHFSNIQLRGGGHVTVRHGAAQSVTLVKGSQEYTRLHMRDGRELVIDACDKRCPSRYDLEIDIVTPDISGVAIDGGGEIEAQSGFPAQDSISVAVNGGGDIDLHAIKAAAAHAAVNGGGKIELTAEHQLNAAVAGGGEIVYHGNPQVNEAVQGGGSVERAGG